MSKYKLFVSCDEAQICCDKSQYNEASFFEKIKLSLHLLYCKACRTYTKNNNKLTDLVNNKKVTSFKETEKNELEKLLQEEIRNLE